MDMKAAGIVPLNGANYPTWKVQCQMALMKEGLWSIVNGSESGPSRSDTDKYAKFAARRDKALATIVLSVDPSLLYLIGDPENPVLVWKKLGDQFQKKTWANKLHLRRKLHSLRLKDGDSVQEHIKTMTEIFNGLSVIGDTVEDDNRVVYLLASLPDSYNTLVTALEANTEVPKMEVVTERLLHEEHKLKERGGSSCGGAEAMFSKQKPTRRGPKCHFCKRFGHIQRNCTERLQADKRTNSDEKRNLKQKANKAETRPRENTSSDDETIGLVACHALSAKSTQAVGNWIVDSGATCHMCTDKAQFVELEELKEPLQVTLGDGHALKAIGRGTVLLNVNITEGKFTKCKLYNVLYVPELSCNLLSISQVTGSRKTVKFNDAGSEILDENQKLIATACRIGSLYYLDCRSTSHQSNTTKVEGKENLWHRRYGHLGTKGLQQLARERLVDGFNYDHQKKIDFCESCVNGKHHRSQFPTGGGKRADQLLGLVHSDVCGKMSSQSLSGAEYFLTFIDDKTRYVWVYVLKRKDQVFSYFIEWKSMVERSTGQQLKTLRTDNGGEYTSNEFEEYLKTEGVKHEQTIPKTPEQNGVAERMNRTLVEAIRSMLSTSKLPHKFWAEALATAVYLRNRSPTKAVKGMTPFEAMTRERPNVEHLKTFGCVAYAHIPKDERQKLDSKSRKCIFLGYGTDTKGYRLYDCDHSRVLYSRDVLFDESSFKVEKSTQQTETRSVIINTPSDEEAVTQDVEVEPVLRRSERDRRTPNYYGDRVSLAYSKSPEPLSLREALTSSDKEKWTSAMEKEMKSLNENDVWRLVELPKDRKAVGSKWVFKLKVGANGSVERYKARLVAQGFSQKFGLDYDETFCPVVRFESIRTVIGLAVQNGLKMHQLDVATAFLNGELEEEVFMKQPEGFVAKGQEHLVCKLNRSIYGLKQSPRCWNSALDNHLNKMGFKQTTSDPCPNINYQLSASIYYHQFS